MVTTTSKLVESIIKKARLNGVNVDASATVDDLFSSDAPRGKARDLNWSRFMKMLTDTEMLQLQTTFSYLLRRNINTVGQYRLMGDGNLLMVRGIGRVRLKLLRGIFGGPELPPRTH